MISPNAPEGKLANARCIPVGTRAKLRILATTDLHMNLTSHNYYADRPDPTVGLTRTATLIRQARAEAKRDGSLVLLFDNGDGLQGAPLSDVVATQPDREHPLMRAFGCLRYDAIGLGNHDFNFGLKSLDAALRQAPCPVLCSNLQRVSSGAPSGFEPFSILDRMVRHGQDEWPIRIGVLSFLPPQTVEWDADKLDGELQAQPIVAAARNWLPDLHAANCDLVIALAHSGICGNAGHTELENAVIPLAALDGIDAIVSGHTHQQFPGPDHTGLESVDNIRGAVHGKPTVMAGASGSHLGVIDLDLVASPNRRWMPAEFECELRPISRRDPHGKVSSLVPEDPKLLGLLSEDHGQVRALMDQPLGLNPVPLHSYFTFFGPDRALALVAEAQAAALNTRLAGTEADGLPVLSATAPSKFGARAGPDYFTDVPAGPLSMRHIADLHVFPNLLRAVILTGDTLLDWLEMSVGLFHQISPGLAGQALVNPAQPGHDFDVIHGLSYEVDLSSPRRFDADGHLVDKNTRRVRKVCQKGRPVRARDRFVVALNSYRANGGGSFLMLQNAQPIPLPEISVRDAIINHVSNDQEAIRLTEHAAPWRFAPMQGTSVSVLTGQGALKHLHELDGRGISTDGVTADGFLRLTVPL